LLKNFFRDSQQGYHKNLHSYVG